MHICLIDTLNDQYSLIKNFNNPFNPETFYHFWSNKNSVPLINVWLTQKNDCSLWIKKQQHKDIVHFK